MRQIGPDIFLRTLPGLLPFTDSIGGAPPLKWVNNFSGETSFLVLPKISTAQSMQIANNYLRVDAARDFAYKDFPLLEV
jgi:hypothetical protein